MTFSNGSVLTRSESKGRMRGLACQLRSKQIAGKAMLEWHVLIGGPE
jgi:hypothetical protein